MTRCRLLTFDVLPVRLAAVLLAVFALAHTGGFLSFTPQGDDARRVLAAMREVTFLAGGRWTSFAGYYRGFGLVITSMYLFLAALAMQISRWTSAAPQVAAEALISMVLLQVPLMVLCLLYFPWPPSILTAVIAGLLIAQRQLVRRGLAGRCGRLPYSE